MTYILQSNVVVSDPTGKYPIVTPFGLADPDLGRFYYAQKAVGLTMSEAHYNAFKSFIDTLKTVGAWAGIKEIYPLYGVSLAGAAIKLRQQHSVGPLTPQNGLSITDFERDSNGYILGAAAGRNYIADSSPGFGTGVTAGQVIGSFGFNAYADATMAFVANQQPKSLWGAYLGAAGGAHVQARINILAADNRTMELQAGSTTSLTTPHVPTPKGLMRFEGRVSGAAIRLDGAQLVTGNTGAGVSSGLAKQLSFLAKTPADGSTITQGFNGAVRFASIDDGSLDAAKRDALRNATLGLMGALGRTF